MWWEIRRVSYDLRTGVIIKQEALREVFFNRIYLQLMFLLDKKASIQRVLGGFALRYIPAEGSINLTLSVQQHGDGQDAPRRKKTPKQLDKKSA